MAEMETEFDISISDKDGELLHSDKNIIGIV